MQDRHNRSVRGFAVTQRGPPAARPQKCKCKSFSFVVLFMLNPCLGGASGMAEPEQGAGRPTFRAGTPGLADVDKRQLLLGGDLAVRWVMGLESESHLCGAGVR